MAIDDDGVDADGGVSWIAKSTLYMNLLTNPHILFMITLVINACLAKNVGKKYPHKWRSPLKHEDIRS